MNNIYCLIFRVPRPLWVPHVEGNIQSVACELCRKRIDVVSVENSPHHSSIVSINERSIVEVLFKLQTKLQITKQMNVILNWVRATSKSILHQPLRGAIDDNDRLREGKVESQNEHILLSVNNNGWLYFLFLLEIPVLYA